MRRTCTLIVLAKFQHHFKSVVADMEVIRILCFWFFAGLVLPHITLHRVTRAFYCIRLAKPKPIPHMHKAVELIAIRFGEEYVRSQTQL